MCSQVCYCFVMLVSAVLSCLPLFLLLSDEVALCFYNVHSSTFSLRCALDTGRRCQVLLRHSQLICYVYIKKPAKEKSVPTHLICIPGARWKAHAFKCCFNRQASCNQFKYRVGNTGRVICGQSMLALQWAQLILIFAFPLSLFSQKDLVSNLFVDASASNSTVCASSLWFGFDDSAGGGDCRALNGLFYLISVFFCGGGGGATCQVSLHSQLVICLV